MNIKNIIRDCFKILYFFTPLLPLALLLSYYYFEREYDDKLLREKGVSTECVVIAYMEGKMGARGPKKGWYNKCQYFIEDEVHYCHIFTTKKPLPFHTKILVRYYLRENGTVRIDFPESYKYEEYGFNDYGY